MEQEKREGGRMDVGRAVVVGCVWGGGGGCLLFKEVCLHKREGRWVIRDFEDCY